MSISRREFMTTVGATGAIYALIGFGFAIIYNTTSIINPRSYRAVSPFDQKHVMRLAFTYKLPFEFTGGGLNRVARQVAGGWATSGFATLASGIPLSVSHANGRPIRIASPKLDGPVGERLGDVRGQRRLADVFERGRLALEPHEPAALAEVLDQLHGPVPPARALGRGRKRSQLEPGVCAEQAHELLSHRAGGSEHRDRYFRAAHATSDLSRSVARRAYSSSPRSRSRFRMCSRAVCATRIVPGPSWYVSPQSAKNGRSLV